MSTPDITTIRDFFRTGAREHERVTVSIEGFRQSAVLVPVMKREGDLTLLFTKRTETVETHKGQISFPGGMTDGRDEDPIHTALREAEEEVGILPDSIEVLGLLDDVATPVGFIITPVVGFIRGTPEFRLNRAEVAEVFDVPLSFFADPSNARKELRQVNGRQYEVWYYNTGKQVIWGATGKIVKMLLEKLKMV